MHTLIVTGGNIETDFALELLKKPWDHVIGVDGGLQFCYDQNICPTRIVGDFDTLNPETLRWYREHTKTEIRTFNPVKDATDTQIAVELAMELGSSRITILGGTGTRMDHVLGNIQTMYLPFSRGIDCRMLDVHNRIRLIQNRYCIRREEQYGQYFSLIPYTSEVRGVTLRGVKYPLQEHDFTVQGSGSFGVSNEILSEQAEILMKSGIMILIESKD